MKNTFNFNRVLLAVALMGGGMLMGVIGFHLTEGYNLLDAAYFTVITMTTVGYGIPGGELSWEGKILVIVLSVFTISVFLFAISTITTFIVEGELQNYFRRQRVNRSIDKLSGHIVVCGLGRNGREAVTELIAQNIPFVVIESREEVIREFQELHPSALILQGDATVEEQMVRAGVTRAKGVISALPDDAANVFVTLTVRELNPTVEVVARASHETTITKLRRAGANRVILPNMIAGKRMARVMTKPSLSDFIDLITGEGQFNLHLEEVDCLEGSNLVGKDLLQLRLRENTGVLLLGVQTREGKFELNPSINRTLEMGEKVFILGTNEQITKFRELHGNF